MDEQSGTTGAVGASAWRRGRFDSLAERLDGWWYGDVGVIVRRVPGAGFLFKTVHGSLHALWWRLDGMSAIGVLYRFWAWQLWRRVMGRPVILQCADGSRLYAPARSRIAGAIGAVGMIEPDDARFALDFLRPGDLFVDVGANIGFYSVLAARRGARVMAFEPTLDTRLVCQGNARLNGVEGAISVRDAACGPTSGTARFTTGLDTHNHLAEDDDPSAISIQMTTLDEEISDAGTGQLMLKVDVEGHDAEVLAGAGEVIGRDRPVILVEVWDGGRSIHDLLSGHGYRAYKYDPRQRRLFAVPSGTDPRGSNNLLFIADVTLGEVTRRLQEGARAPLSTPAIHWRLPQNTPRPHAERA